MASWSSRLAPRRESGGVVKGPRGVARSHAQPLGEHGEHGEHGALAPFPFTAMGATAPHYLPRVCAADRLQIL